jgi:hypothetical protein
MHMFSQDTNLNVELDLSTAKAKSTAKLSSWALTRYFYSWTVFMLSAEQQVYRVRKEDVWVVSKWAFYVRVVVAECWVWITSAGRRESRMLNWQMVKVLTMTRTFDVSNAQKRLGFGPRVSVEKGIRRAVGAFGVREGGREEGLLED